MTVKTESRINNPDNVEVSMTITMSLKEWNKLERQLTGEDLMSSPGYQIRSEISQMVRRSRALIYAGCVDNV